MISGTGSNLQALIDTAGRGELGGSIAAVFSDRENAYGLARAKAAGVPGHHLSPAGFASREQFDAAVADILEPYDPALLVLAGFMRILSGDFVRRFQGRIINVHPSLLPRYPGLNTHQRVLDAGDLHHGATVHFVTRALDAGPRIIQYRLRVEPDDTPEGLSARVQEGEHSILPRAARWFLTGRLRMIDDLAVLDDRKLEDPVLVDRS